MSEKIKTIIETSSADFDKAVNSHLDQGWRLHGAPNITTTAHQDQWEDRLRSWSKTTFVQVLVYGGELTSQVGA